MKIGKYISELLFDNDFVILPELGEFSTKYIPAKFIPELKKVESPSKVIDFNPKNKTGGGLLIEYIAEKEGISSQQAKEFVTNFVDEMKNSLKSGKKVELESVGVFALAEGGDIKFTPDKSINYLSDSAGMSSVKEPSKKSEEEAKSELDKLIEKAKTETPPQKEEPPKKEDKSDPVKKAEGAPAVPPKPAESQKPTEQPKTTAPTSKKPLDIPQKPETKASRPAATSQQPPAGKQGLPPAAKWVALTVVPLLIVIIVLALNFDYFFGGKSDVWRSDEPAVETRHEAPEAVAEPADERADEVEAEAEAEAFDPTQPPPSPEAGRTVYYIIVGSFEEQHSADILAEELRTKGARTASVFPINRLGFYRVSYGYYYDLSEAERHLQQAKEVNPNAWILHR